LNVLELIAARFREHPAAAVTGEGNGAAGADGGPRDAALRMGDGAAADGDGHDAPILPLWVWERALLGPAGEFLRRPGKGLRGRLVESGWDLTGGADGELPPELPALVELIHASSLIIDDIQDGSDERRGAPALHRTCGTAVALNTGNWMMLLPLYLLGQIDLPPVGARAAHDRLVATLVSCHQGQALDLLPVGELGQNEVAQVVATSTLLRTAGLTELAAVLGGLAAGAAPSVLAALAELGREYGRALQMFDDLGGLVASERRDKGYEDLRHSRPTWAWAWAAEIAAGADYDALSAAARRVADGDDPEPLRRRLVRAVEAIGRDRARAALDRASAVLSAKFPPSAARDQAAGAIALLGDSYG